MECRYSILRLDRIDRKLEKRGWHRFRGADEVIYYKNEKPGEGTNISIKKIDGEWKISCFIRCIHLAGDKPAYLSKYILRLICKKARQLERRDL